MSQIKSEILGRSVGKFAVHRKSDKKAGQSGRVKPVDSNTNQDAMDIGTLKPLVLTMPSSGFVSRLERRTALQARTHYHASEFMLGDTHEFLSYAYLALLRRNPDESGLRHYGQLLSEGVPRIAVLTALSKSPEAAETGVRLRGAAARFALYQFLMLPVLRAILLPMVKPHVDPVWMLVVDNLGFLRDDEFVDRLYRELLGRESDHAGRAHYLSMLSDGVSRTEVALDIAYSSEGRRLGRRVKCSRGGRAKWLLSKWPLIGNLVRPTSARREIAGLTGRLSNLQNTVSVMRQEMSSYVADQERDLAALLAQIQLGHGASNRFVEARFLQLEQLIAALEDKLRAHQQNADERIAPLLAGSGDTSGVLARLEALDRANKENVRLIEGYKIAFKLIERKADRENLVELEERLRAEFDSGGQDDVLSGLAKAVESLNAKVTADAMEKVGFAEIESAIARIRLVQESAVGRLRDEITRLNLSKADMQALNVSRSNVRQELDKLGLDLRRHVEHLIEPIEKRIADLKREVTRQYHRLGDLSKSAEKHFDMVAVKKDRNLDEMYATLEGKFQGARADIGSRQRIYLDHVQRIVESAGGARVIDIGCGRGEWLELLSEHGIAATGVEQNRNFLTQCRRRKLDVVESDAIDYLKRLPDNSIAVVSAFHVIEHLATKEFIALLDEAARVLVPGGVVVVEIPNPRDLMVGSGSFYLDPTHRYPLPSELTAILVEACRFEVVEIRCLHSVDPEPGAGNSQSDVTLKELVLGSVGYSVIARKV
ncbi:DUF4214 domain-containing protein [Burkholderia cenocepacia]|nr:DUF4214 domain-containing protein [Burkholderia cenocepacia]MBR8407760.1 DUF4214 domain-containing protein [Burkholderia cenocepacia]MDR5641741.1 DUF4214 domain-containing protein [Burkholderia cenocepacia]MDR8051309.1 DUF4214 domain-containing protein [Burkholderia cenocepacia]